MEMISKVLLLTKALQVASVDGLRYGFAMTCGLVLTKTFQVANVDRFRYSFAMTYGLLITYGFEGK